MSLQLNRSAMIGSLFAVSAAIYCSGQANAQFCGYLGEIKPFAGYFAPSDTIFANGQLLSVEQYTALFSLYGTTYGGDGRNTFGVPDLRGRIPVREGLGMGLTRYRLGELAGSETTQYGPNNLANHTHTAQTTATLHASSADGTLSAPAGNVTADDGTDRIYVDGPPSVTMNAAAITATTTVDPVGGTSITEVDNSMPSLALNYVVCLQGVYPPRG